MHVVPGIQAADLGRIDRQAGLNQVANTVVDVLGQGAFSVGFLRDAVERIKDAGGRAVQRTGARPHARRRGGRQDVEHADGGGVPGGLRKIAIGVVHHFGEVALAINLAGHLAARIVEAGCLDVILVVGSGKQRAEISGLPGQRQPAGDAGLAGEARHGAGIPEAAGLLVCPVVAVFGQVAFTVDGGAQQAVLVVDVVGPSVVGAVGKVQCRRCLDHLRQHGRTAGKVAGVAGIARGDGIQAGGQVVQRQCAHAIGECHRAQRKGAVVKRDTAARVVADGLGNQSDRGSLRTLGG